MVLPRLPFWALLLVAGVAVASETKPPVVASPAQCWVYFASYGSFKTPEKETKREVCAALNVTFNGPPNVPTGYTRTLSFALDPGGSKCVGRISTTPPGGPTTVADGVEIGIEQRQVTCPASSCAVANREYWDVGAGWYRYDTGGTYTTNGGVRLSLVSGTAQIVPETGRARGTKWLCESSCIYGIQVGISDGKSWTMTPSVNGFLR